MLFSVGVRLITTVKDSHINVAGTISVNPPFLDGTCSLPMDWLTITVIRDRNQEPRTKVITFGSVGTQALAFASQLTRNELGLASMLFT